MTDHRQHTHQKKPLIILSLSGWGSHTQVMPVQAPQTCRFRKATYLHVFYRNSRCNASPWAQFHI